MTDNVELVVKIASGGTGQTIKDVVDLQQSIKTLGKDARDTQKLAQSLGKAFNLPDDQVRDLAEALAEAKQETSKLKKEANGLGKIFEGIAQGVGQSLANQGIEALRGSLSAVIGVATAALGEFQGFEKALVEFDAKSDATAEQIARIGEQAKELAAVTSQTPAGVAELSTALLTLGATADDVEDNLASITKLADVLGEDPVLTGQVVQTGVNIFGEFGESADSLSDKLNFLINNSAAGAQGGLNEFFQLFADVGGIVKATGADFDELAATFAVLRNGGASASIAATGIKTALLALSAPTSAANAELEKIGLSAFDANGEFRGLETVLLEASEALKTASEQEQVEFANKVFGREGAPAFLTALKEANGGLGELIEGLNTGADGSLEESLEVINQSLSRQAELFQGNLSGALTSFGEALSPVASGVIELANELLSATVEGSDGFDGLTAAGERLRAVLTENPELLERISEALVTLVDTGVDQLELLVDAVTAFVAEEENVEFIASAIEDLGGVLQLLGQGARFVIALAEGLIQLNEGTTFVERLVPPIRILNDTLDRARAAADGLFQQLDKLGLIDLPEAQEFQGISAGLDQASAALDNYNAAAQKVADAAPEKPIQDTAGAVTDAANDIESGVDSINAKYQQLADEADLATQQLIASRLEQGASAEEITGIEAKALNDRIALNRQKSAELQAINQASLSPEDAEKLGDQIVATETAIATDRVKIAKDQAAERQRLAEEAAKAEADALKEVQEEQKRLAEESFDNDAEQRQRTFDDAKAQRDTALENRLNTLREQGQRGIEDLKKQSQESLQADAEAFQKRQQADAEAFQKRLDAERDRESSRIDAAASEAEFQTALRLADSDEEREELEAAREQAQKRAEILAEEEAKALRTVRENDVPELSPVEQARLDLEERIAAKQQGFQAQQQAETAAFEEQQQQQRESDEQVIAELEKENAEAIAQVKRDAAEDERQREREFEKAQQQLEGDFKDEQRRLDKQNAEEIARILEEARGSGGVQASLRKGGPVEAGGLYQVHKDEFFVPNQSGTILSQRESRSLVSDVLSARETAAMMAQTRSPVSISAPQVTGAAMHGVEARLNKLIQLVEQNRQVQAQANYTIVNEGSAPNPIEMELQRISGLVKQSGL